jgi:hypothetical protein
MLMHWCDRREFGPGQSPQCAAAATPALRTVPEIRSDSLLRVYALNDLVPRRKELIFLVKEGWKQITV